MVTFNNRTSTIFLIKCDSEKSIHRNYEYTKFKNGFQINNIEKN